jgi:N-acetylglucosaminyldiphosphoundecaprenol N-acetyl-beta-D-mannosaminyltransferase
MNILDSNKSQSCRVRIEKAYVDVISIDDALDRALNWLGSDVPGVVMAINPEKIRAIGDDPMLEKFNAESGLAIPDGMGVVLAAKLLGFRNAERITGIDFCERLIERCAEQNIPIFMYGASGGVAEAAARALKERYAGLNIAGAAHGFVPIEEQDALVAKIVASGAKVLLVALGSPRQELWINKNLHRLGAVRIVQGVGGSFDVFSGRLKRAPESWQKLGLEWLYRLFAQPSRLPRYLKLLGFFPVLWRSAISHRGN